MNPIGRPARSVHGQSGTIIQWEPLSSGMCDTLVQFDDGRECWFSMTDLRPTDGDGPLPNRQEAIRQAKAEALEQLRDIQARHIAGLNKPWPGCEFAKALVGNAIQGAIARLDTPPGGTRP